MKAKVKSKRTMKQQTLKSMLTKHENIIPNGVAVQPLSVPPLLGPKNSSANVFIGAHVSIKCGLENVFKEASAIGARSIAFFLRPPTNWSCKTLGDDVIQRYKTNCLNSLDFKDQRFIVPHGILLLNCGSPDETNLKKSRTVLLDEMQRCDALGIRLYNIHPGSTCGKMSRSDCTKLIADSINFALERTSTVKVLLENMSKQGNTIGGTFEELRDIIALIKQKERIGVCLDTCHAFAAGWDLNAVADYEKMWTSLQHHVGLEYLCALHLNGSKSDCGSHLDRHEDIGAGKITVQTFKRLMNDPRIQNIPLILETPETKPYAAQIQMLYEFID